jgi:hypothetical protein
MMRCRNRCYDIDVQPTFNIHHVRFKRVGLVIAELSDNSDSRPEFVAYAVLYIGQLLIAAYPLCIRVGLHQLHAERQKRTENVSL